MVDQIVNEGEKASKPTDPVKYGYTFGGWFLDETTTYAFTEPVTSNITLKALWTKNGDKLLIITKNLSLAGDADKTPNVTFQFKVEADASNPAEEPEINNGQPIRLAFTEGDTVEGGKVTKSAEYNLTQNLTGWTAEGLYRYTITEVPNTYETFEDNATGEKKEMTQYDSSSYRLELDVRKGSDGAYVIAGMAVKEKGEDSKIDDGGVSFDNEYTYTKPTPVTPKTTLIVSKTVDGAEKGDTFKFTIIFTAAEGYESDAPVVTTAGSNAGIATGTTIAYGKSVTFNLKKDESVTFTLPVGTTYSLLESAAQNYKPAVVVTATSDGTNEELKNQKGSLSKALKVEDLVASGTDSNTAAFTNTYTEPENPLTGIIEKNGPFLILILVAVLGFAFYLADRRRKARR